MPGTVEKGITITFKGDTVEFDKSVDGVNKGLNVLKTEIKEINKQLKLDPSNVDLLKNKFSNLQDQQKLLQVEVEEYQKRLDEMDKSEIGSKEWVKLQKEMENAQFQLEKVTKQVNTFAKANLELVGLGEKFKEVGNKAEKMASQLKPLSDIGLAIAGSFGAATLSASKYADDVNTLAKQFDLTTEQIQKFQLASELIDVDLNTITKSYSKLTKSMVSESGDVTEAFARLGISVRDNNGELRSANDVFNETIEALAGIDNETEQDAVAMTIFGKSAAELGPLINGGTEALAEFSKYLEENGLILSQDELDALNSTNDAFDKIKATLSAFTRKIATSLAPTFQKAFEKINQAVLKFKDFWDGLSPSVQRLIPIIAGLVGALAPALTIFSKLSTSIGGIISKLGWNGGLGSTIKDLMNPVTAIVAVFALLYATSDTFRESVNSLVSSLITNLVPIITKIIEIGTKLWEILSTLLMPIITAIGDWLGTYILPALQTLIETWLPILSNILDILIGLLELIVGWVGDLWDILKDVGVIDAIGGAFEGLGKIISGLTEIVKTIWSWFGNLISRAKEFLGLSGQISGAMASGIGSFARSGGYGSGGYGSGAFNVSIVVNNGNNITPTQVRGWVDIINEELGGLI